ISYRELDEKANQLAHHLRSRGVGPDILVGLCMERVPELVVAILGILKAGGAYVPLDLAYPKDRVAFMLEDAGVSIVVTQTGLAADVANGQVQIIRMDADWPEISRHPASNPAAAVRPEHLAYVIYT